MNSLTIVIFEQIKKIYYFLLCIFFFLLPTNLFFKFNPSSAYVNGLLVDYLIPKFYLSDAPILLLLALWSMEVIFFKEKKVNFLFKKKTLPLFLFLFLFIARQFFTPYPLAAVWYLLKLFEVLLLGKFLLTHQSLLKKPLILYSALATVIFQSSLAIYQFFTQKSLVGYSLLGEPNLSHSIGLAKDTFWSTGRVLPYATTAHPNILGGFLAIFSLFIFSKLLKTKKMRLRVLIIGSLLLAIFALALTQSISAIISLSIGILLLTLKPYYQKLANISKKMLIGVGIVLAITPIIINLATKKFEFDSLTRRSYLQTAAIKMWIKQPFFGVGLNQFTARVEEFSPSKEVVRFVQPAHHIGLLWLAETGVLGIILIWVFGKKLKIKKIILPLVMLLPLIVLDHYLLTQQSGLLLFIFTLSLLF